MMSSLARIGFGMLGLFALTSLPSDWVHAEYLPTTPEECFDIEKNEQGEGVISYYKCSESVMDFVIPAVMGGTRITTIGYKAFAKKQLTSVQIPEGVTCIEFGAFYGNQLTIVLIPGCVTRIERSAFYQNQLTGVVISEGVRSMDSYVFDKNSLTSVTLSSSVEFNENTFPPAPSGTLDLHHSYSLLSRDGKAAGTYVFGELGWIK